MSKRILHGILIGIVASLTALTLQYTGLLDWLEGPTWNLRVRAFQDTEKKADQIRIILLDQASLNWGAEPERKWPWPWYRTIHSAVLSFCRRGGAKSVAFDFTFTEPSRMAGDDAELAAAIAKPGAFSSAVFIGRRQGRDSSWPSNTIMASIPVQGLDAYLTGPAGNYRNVFRGEFPIPEITSVCPMFGNVFATPERNNVVTRMDPFHVFDGRFLPSLGLSAYLSANTNASLAIKGSTLLVDGHKIPLDSYGRAILRYRGKVTTFQTVSAQAVIQSELRLAEGGTPVLDPSFFKDCYVFYGSSAIGLLDLKPTPVSHIFPGVALHATFLDNLLSDSFIRDLPLPWVIICTLFFALLAGVVTRLASTGLQMSLSLIAFLGIPLLPGFLMYPLGYWMPVAVLETASAVALAWALIANYAIEGRQKRFIKQAFRQYLSGPVIEKLIENPATLQLGGETRELTILFSDIRGFTSISESLTPEKLTVLLNEYLTAMSDIIMDEGGTVDKYLGDAIVAFWNAPMDCHDHPARAVKAALLCQQKLAEMRPYFRKTVGHDIYVRIGINTGRVVIGNMGSARRFNYTFLGDAGNLASRLEGLNKYFGTFMMISEDTRKRLPPEFSARELSRVRVLGKKEAVTVFEPMYRADYDAKSAIYSAFNQALKAFYDGHFTEAIKLFSAIAKDDPPAAIYAERCRSLVDNPPEKWEGVWEMKEK